MKKRLLCFALLTILLLSKKTYGQQDIIFPSVDWEYESENSKCNPYSGLKPFIIDSLNTTGLLIIKGGKISFQYGDIEEISYVASVRKSILSMMYGKYVADGTIDLNSTLEVLQIDDINPLTSEEKQATVNQIINARSGIYLPASNAGSAPNMPKRGQYKPGSHFYYNNWDFNVAGTIFEQQTGKGIYDAFQEDIAIPLNFQDFELSNHRRSGNKKMSSHLAYHFHLSTRDMARLGYLMLRKGKWNDKQIIPKEWIERTTTNVSDTDDYGIFKGYSYMWWRYENPEYKLLEDAYSASGAYGQFITVIPKLDMVIAHKTKRIYERGTSQNEYDKFILKLLEGISSYNQSKSNISYDNYLGNYTDNSREGRPMPIEIYSDDGKIILKAPMFPKPMQLNFCNENLAYMSDPRMGQFDLQFERDDNGVILGFRVRNVFIKKN
jgi:CubicO group peptidase (beta-lactamase class C family)